jgi:hypothetical protein
MMLPILDKVGDMLLLHALEVEQCQTDPWTHDGRPRSTQDRQFHA